MSRGRHDCFLINVVGVNKGVVFEVLSLGPQIHKWPIKVLFGITENDQILIFENE